MRSAVIICIAYIIGIIEGLYLDLYLSIVSLFLLICVMLLFNTRVKKLENTNCFRNKCILLVLVVLLGICNVKIRAYCFETKYQERGFL